MSDKNQDRQEFAQNLHSPLKGVTTRAVVVSNKDPQFAGRVKVWIPALHGGFNTDEDPDQDPSVQTQDNQPSLPKGANYPGSWKDSTVQDLLPWAKCLGHSWGSRQNDLGAINLSGNFSIPKVGTEVFVAFENDDVDLPIVLGAIYHSSEFSYQKYRPLELFPGTEVNSSEIDYNRYTSTGELSAMDVSDYEDKAAFSYSVRAENDNMLYISDFPGESCILLSGLIKLSDVDTLIGAKAAAIKAAYPGFPTTASAAFAKRVVLADNATALADPNIKYNPPFDQINTTPDVKSTLPPSNTQAASPTPATPPATTAVKQWPIKPGVGKSVPIFSDQGHYPQGNFGAPRTYYRNQEKKHCGLDLAAAHDNSTLLLAPIEMAPLYYVSNSSEGNALDCLAVDGTGHCFMHLQSIFPAIMTLMKTTPGKTVPAGTPLVYCGNTGHSTGAHLHWEIVRDASAAKSAQQIESIRLAAQAVGTSKYYNPLDWMGMPVSANPNVSTVIQGSPEQMRSMVNHQVAYANTNDVNFAKPIGLEISTVPGQETLYLRHPSGAFIGFDCDGNLQCFTPGDANWRVNRSWNLDVLGGILEVCYAKFTRVKTVLRTWAKIFAQMKDKPAVDGSYPDFFQRAEHYRKVDQLVSLRSTLGNAIYVNKDGNPVPMQDAFSNNLTGVVTPPSTANKNFTLTTFDSMLQTSYSKYITGSLQKAFPDWKWFKAQMLLESNGDANASGGGAVGLLRCTKADTLGMIFKVS